MTIRSEIIANERGAFQALPAAASLLGGLLLAGAFAFAPGRLLHDWLFGTHLAHLPG